MTTERMAGIYQIRNLNNSKRYIGSSQDVRDRWDTHRCLLRRGKHHSLALQRSWNKNGESAFVFEKLIICDPEMCEYYEQRLLDYLNPPYNMSPSASKGHLGIRRSLETRRRMSEAAIKRVHGHGWKHRPETIEKMRATAKGRDMTKALEGRRIQREIRKVAIQ